MKKLIAILLALSIVFTLGIPAFASEETEPVQDAVTEESADPEDLIEDIVGSQEFLDIIQSEEVMDALEEGGFDVEELEESIEAGEVEIIEVPEEILPENLNLFELYGLSVMTVVIQGIDSLTSGLFLIGLAPVGLFLWVIPPVGAAYMIIGIPMGIALALGGVALIVVSPIAGAVVSAIIKSE